MSFSRRDRSSLSARARPSLRCKVDKKCKKQKTNHDAADNDAGTMLTRATFERIGRTVRKTIDASAARRSVHSTAAASAGKLELEFPGGEPAEPRVTTKIPGPRSMTSMEALSAHTSVGSIRYFVDFERSRGNYVVDADGNEVLDMYAHIASLPVGYNHPKMLAALRDEANIALLAHRPALGNNPPLGWEARVERTLMRVAPKGLSRATTMACGACANEHAMKAVFISAANARRAGAGISEDEKASCLNNKAPGTPDFKILSFDGAFHGRTAACLSLTHTKWIHKLDFPTFDWPSCPFPKLKYPLSEHIEENAAEEARCLALVEEALKKDRDVVGIIVEPMQAEGGDNHASADFFRKLRGLTKRENVRMIVDEVQTGCGSSGTFWAHEAWNMEHPPDVVTFSKKMQIAGFYTAPELQPELPYRIFNTWMGDPAKLIQLEVVIDAIERDNLLEVVKDAGKTLLEGLEEMQQKYPSVLANARGVGTLVAIDCDTPARREAVLSALLQNGVDIGGCGSATIRARPGLFFTSQHARVFLKKFDDVLSEVVESKAS